MIKAADIKKGDIVEVNGTPHIVEELTVQTPSARGGATLYKFRFRDLRTRQKTDGTNRGDDPYRECDFERRPCQFLYREPGGCTFMDLEDYSQFTLSDRDLAEQMPFLPDGLEGIQSLVSDGRVLGIELPAVIELDIVETEPAIRGATATGRTKSARLSTGHSVKVPEYMATGDRVRVDTRNGQFVSRA